MARGQTALEVAAVELPETQNENSIDEIENNILAAFDAADENVSFDIRVYQLEKGDEQYLFSVDPSELSGIMDRLRDTIGTGRYRTRVYKIVGKRKGVFRAFDYSIKAAPKPYQAPERQSEMSTVLAAIAAQNEKTMGLLERLAERQQQPFQAAPQPINPFSLMTEMATAMGAMMTALRPSEGTSTTDLIIKGVELRDKLANSGGGGGGDDDGEISLTGLVKAALQSPVVQQIVENVVTQAKQPQPAPVQVNSNPAQTQIKQPSIIGADPQTEAYIKRELAYLNGRAAQGKDAGFYADFVFDNWPRELITYFIAQPNGLQLINNFMPETLPNAAWFNKLIEELRKLVNNTSGQTATGSDAPGHSSAAVANNDNPGRSGGSEDDIADDEWSS